MPNQPRPAHGHATVPRLTVVVPTRNSERTIHACLASARAQTLPIEVIVVDNFSADSTVAISRPIADTVESHGPERSAQRNRGAEIARGEYLLFLDSDLILDARVVEEAVEMFDGDPSLGALVIPESAFGVGFWARCRELEKEIYRGDSSVEAARIFRRDAFDTVGGYDTALTGGEDWDLPDRVVDAGWTLSRTEAGATHDEGTLRLSETFRKKLYYGRSIPSYLAKSKGTGVRRLFRVGLLRRPGLLLRRPVRALGLLALKAVEAAGLASGMLAARRVN